MLLFYLVGVSIILFFMFKEKDSIMADCEDIFDNEDDFKSLDSYYPLIALIISTLSWIGIGYVLLTIISGNDE